MLTLFLMLGAAYVVATSRARETARAYARLTLGGDSARVPAPQLLDGVMLTVLRGPSISGTLAAVGGTPVIGGTISFESLLADKYGLATATGSAAGIAPAVTTTATDSSILSATISLSSSLRPTDLNGRLLSFVAPGRAVTSHRILRAWPSDSSPSNAQNGSRASFSLYLDTPASQRPFTLPSAGRVIVNGREFTGPASINPPANEPWDAFDAHNPFLAQVATGSTISTSTVSRFSYLPALPTTSLTASWDYDGDGIPDAADNDNDGVFDGVFLDFGIPDATDANGNAVRLRASVLVVDLDGRFNLNAHDSLARVLYTGTNYNWISGSNNCWPAFPASANLGTGTVPMGSGYGPAEVNGSWMTFTSSSLTGKGVNSFATTENPLLLSLAGGGTSTLFNGRRPGGSRYSSGNSTPVVGSLEGRYGEKGAARWTTVSGSMFLTSGSFAVPGATNVDDEPGRTNDRRADPTQPSSVNYGVPPVWWTGTNGFNWSSPPAVTGTTVPTPRSVFNSPPDLQGRMQTITGSAAAGGIVPQLLFAKPEWFRLITEDRNSNGVLDAGEDVNGNGVLDVYRYPAETIDDPYEYLLDTRFGRGGQLHDPATDGTTLGALIDNSFLPTELEAVLRPYDVDSNRLPPRLAAMLGSAAEEARLKVTTDGWDTTAITGSAALALFGTAGGSGGWVQNCSGPLYGTDMVTGIIGGEISRGERLDLNRGLLASGTDTGSYNFTNSTTAGTYYRQRQALFKDYYTLLVMLSSTGGSVPTVVTQNGTVTGTAAAAILAQYAANTVDFRDADSVMTPFEYDLNPLNGWDIDGDASTADAGSNERRVVFGAERPEILIQQALAWRNTISSTGGMLITLHRPWKAIASATTPIIGIATTEGEPCDYALDTLVDPANSAIISGTAGIPNNLVDLGKKPHAQIMLPGLNASFNDVSGTNYPIWRLRIVSGTDTRYVRFDTNTPGTDEFAPAITTGSTKLRLGADSTITMFSGTTILLTATNSLTGTISGTAFVTVSGTAVSGLRVPGNLPFATISLERLSNPGQGLTPTGTIPGTSVTGSTVWNTGTADPRQITGTTTVPLQYVVVDSCTVTVLETSTSGITLPIVAGTSCMRSTTSATTAFWATGTLTTYGNIQNGSTVAFPTPLASGNTAWLPWPNRPFVSATELMLVPRSDALGLLQNYQRPTVSNQSTVGIPVAPDLLFDAVHVPTRFAGVHRSNFTAASGSAGIYTTANQISSFREPGRVNLNTISGSDVWNAVVAGQLPAPVQSFSSWSTLITSGTPARSMAHLLALSATGSGYGILTVTDTAAAGTSLATGTSLNPLHGLYTATRLANTTTPRSNVFAVWVTLRESTANDPDSVRIRRAFYVIDRSIPVGYEDGRDHNVRNAIRLRRIIE